MARWQPLSFTVCVCIINIQKAPSLVVWLLGCLGQLYLNVTFKLALYHKSIYLFKIKLAFGLSRTRDKTERERTRDILIDVCLIPEEETIEIIAQRQTSY